MFLLFTLYMFRESYLPSSGTSLHTGPYVLTICQYWLSVVTVNPITALFESQVKVKFVAGIRNVCLQKASQSALVFSLPSVQCTPEVVTPK
jgi:hypothetical protein